MHASTHRHARDGASVRGTHAVCDDQQPAANKGDNIRFKKRAKRKMLANSFDGDVVDSHMIHHEESARLNEFIAIRMFKRASPLNRPNIVVFSFHCHYCRTRFRSPGLIRCGEYHCSNFVSAVLFLVLHLYAFLLFFENNFSRHCEYSPSIWIWWILSSEHIHTNEFIRFDTCTRCSFLCSAKIDILFNFDINMRRFTETFFSEKKNDRNLFLTNLSIYFTHFSLK